MCNIIQQIDNQLPDQIPLDGIAIVALTWFLSTKESRLKNSLIIGGIHGLIHNSIADKKPCTCCGDEEDDEVNIGNGISRPQ